MVTTEESPLFVLGRFLGVAQLVREKLISGEKGMETILEISAEYEKARKEQSEAA